MKMQRKIFNTFLIVIAIPTVAFLIFILEISTRTIEKRTIAASELVVKESVKRVDTLLNNYRKASMQIYYNQNVMDFLVSNSTSEAEGEQNLPIIDEILGSIVNADKYLMSAVLQSGDNLVIQGTKVLNISEYLDAHREGCYIVPGQINWIPSQKMKNVFGLDSFYFGVMRLIRHNDREVGKLLFLVRGEFFDDIYAGAIPENSGNDLILAPDGIIISSRNESLIGTRIEDSRFEDIISGKTGTSGSHLTKTESGNSYLIYARSEESGWYFIREMEAKTILYGIIKLKQSLIAIIILFCSFLILLSYLFSRGLSRPINNLVTYIDGIGSHSQDVPQIDKRFAGDEITKLQERLLAMESRIDALIDEVSQKERLKTQAELKALRNHISPHFIYNALDTIRWMAVINKQENIKRMVSALDKLMRYAADFETVLIKLDDEMDLIREYVIIQKMRYSDIELVINIPEEISGLMVNKFIIQTIVENSIVHGFKDYKNTGIISISASIHDEVLELIVEDNGKGFDPAGILTGSKPHTGLKSVNQRLELNYGPEFNVTVSSELGKGTKAVIHLPVLG